MKIEYTKKAILGISIILLTGINFLPMVIAWEGYIEIEGFDYQAFEVDLRYDDTLSISYYVSTGEYPVVSLLIFNEENFERYINHRVEITEARFDNQDSLETTFDPDYNGKYYLVFRNNYPDPITVYVDFSIPQLLDNTPYVIIAILFIVIAIFLVRELVKRQQRKPITRTNVNTYKKFRAIEQKSPVTIKYQPRIQFCGNCGHHRRDYGKFCENCGYRIE